MTRGRCVSVLGTGLVVTACLGSGEAPGEEALPVGEDVELEGVVLEIDRTPMFVDGDGELRLRVDQHGVVLVRIPARERVCEARGRATFDSLEVDEGVRVRGRVTAPGELTVCADRSHLLERRRLPPSR